jgi:SAM-dependent methyltransferase
LTESERDFIERTLRLEEGSRILDIPCGRGRHALALARRGYRMTAVDISRENIEKARACDPQGKVEWVCCDMRRFDAATAFDAAFCWGNSFAYTTHRDTKEFLVRVAKALKPGARFAVQTGIAAEALLPHLKEREEYRFGEIEFVIENEYDAAASCLETRYSFIKDGRVERKRGRQFVYTIAEIGRLLAAAGLEQRAFLGSMDGRPFVMGDPVLVAVAEKRGPYDRARRD